MIAVELLKDVGPYAKGTVIQIDEKGADQLVESKRGKVLTERQAEKAAQESTEDA